MIPFSPPRIDEKTIEAVAAVLRSGWITTGPQVRQLESRINAYCGSRRTLCLNSWTNAAELVLRWYGIGTDPLDEVVLPAYTYAATANIVEHCGARVVFVDSSPGDFTPDPEQFREACTGHTKALLPVDIGGMPSDYDALMQLGADLATGFHSNTAIQSMLGRPLVMADSAHSFGARYHGHPAGSTCDVHGFSFHAVKNLTTAEGGALTLQFPEPFNNDDIWQVLNRLALHGQTKDALAKSGAGQWQYDISEAGYKCNMTDIHAAIGLVEMERYEEETLPRRKRICAHYQEQLSKKDWFIAPAFRSGERESSCHLFMLRIHGINESTRDEIIAGISRDGVAVNVHFKPVHMMSYYRQAYGCKPSDFPNAYLHYSTEISLPVYYDLSDSQVDTVLDVVIRNIEKHLA